MGLDFSFLLIWTLPTFWAERIWILSISICYFLGSLGPGWALGRGLGAGLGLGLGWAACIATTSRCHVGWSFTPSFSNLWTQWTTGGSKDSPSQNGRGLNRCIWHQRMTLNRVNRTLLDHQRKITKKNECVLPCKNCQRLSQMRPGGLSRTNQDLADIFGRTESHSDNFHICIF